MALCELVADTMNDIISIQFNRSDWINAEEKKKNQNLPQLRWWHRRILTQNLTAIIHSEWVNKCWKVFFPPHCYSFPFRFYRVGIVRPMRKKIREVRRKKLWSFSVSGNTYIKLACIKRMRKKRTCKVAGV